MQVSVESGEGLTKKMRVELPAERVNEVVDAKLKEVARTVRLDGFRPGKVPVRVVKQRFGAQIRQDAYGDLIQASFYEAAEKEALFPVGDPKIELHEDEEGNGGLSYTATFEVMPKVELADFTALSIKRPQAQVTDADVDAMIEKLRDQRKEWNPVERPAQDGDRLTIDFTGYLDGEAFDGGSASDFQLVLGSGTMIPGFEEGLKGAKAGEERKLEVKFPDDYSAEHLAGKEATFDVTIKEVAEPVLPEVDEAFIKALGVEAGTEDALRKEVRENMERELKQKLKSLTKERVMDAMLQAHDLQVPSAMVQREAEHLKRQAQEEMAGAGQRSAVDLPVSLFEPQAERRVKLGLLVGEIIKSNSMNVDQERVDQAIAEQAATFEEPQQIIDWYAENPEARKAVENVVMEDQVVDWVLDQAQVEDENLTFDELVNSK